MREAQLRITNVVKQILFYSPVEEVRKQSEFGP